MPKRSAIVILFLLIGAGLWWLLQSAEPVVQVEPPGASQAARDERSVPALGDLPSAQRGSAVPTIAWQLRAVLTNPPAVRGAAGARLLYRVPGVGERHKQAEADANGAFALPLAEVPAEFAIWHRHGVRRQVQRAAGEAPHPTAGAAEQVVELAPAGALLVSCPEVDAPFVVRLAPLAGVADATLPSFLDTQGRQGAAICEGVPAAWGDVTIEVLVDQNLVAVGRSVVVAGADTTVTLRALSTCSVRGQVTDAQGASLRGAIVSTRPADEFRDRERSRIAESDKDGRFVLPSMAPVPMRLAVSMRGFVTHRALLDCTPGIDIDLGTIVLSRGRSLRGQVRHPDAKAPGDLRTMFPKLKVACVSLAGGSELLRQSTQLVARAGADIDADGRFEFTGLSPGQYQVAAAETGVTGVWSGTVVRITDSDLADIVLEVPRRRIWQCEIAIAPGQTPGHALAEVYATSSSGSWFAKADVDGAGRAELQVGPGPFLVGVRIGLAVRWLRPSTGDQSPERVELPAGSLTVEGLDLRNAGDLQYAGATLVYLEGQLPPEFLPLSMYSGPLAVDATGNLVVPNLPAGRFRLELLAPNWGRRSMLFDLQKDEVTSRYWVPQAR
jgi:hypothetical protein